MRGTPASEIDWHGHVGKALGQRARHGPRTCDPRGHQSCTLFALGGGVTSGAMARVWPCARISKHPGLRVCSVD